MQLGLICERPDLDPSRVSRSKFACQGRWPVMGSLYDANTQDMLGERHFIHSHACKANMERGHGMHQVGSTTTSEPGSIAGSHPVLISE